MVYQETTIDFLVTLEGLGVIKMYFIACKHILQ